MILCYSLVYATTNKKPNMYNAYQQFQSHQLILFVVLFVRLSVNISSEIEGLWIIYFFLSLSFVSCHFLIQVANKSNFSLIPDAITRFHVFSDAN